MYLKYCYLNEIHKTYILPPDLSLMKEEITSIFIHKLPSPFLIQYQDADGDKVSITTDQEYQALLKYELSNLPSLKIYIVSLEGEQSSPKQELRTERSHSNGSFEVIDDEKSEGIKELNISKNEIQEEGKIVVSLQIPGTNPNTLKSLENIEEPLQEDVASPSLKSQKNKSKDMIGDLSLSFEDERSNVLQKILDKGFQTEAEENSKENQKKNLNLFVNRAETKRKATVDILESSENDSKDFQEYLNRIITKKSQIGRIQSSPKFSKLLYCSIKNSEKKSNKEESQERWVSFSSELDEMQTPHNLEIEGKNLFSLKQNLEDWGAFCQEKFERYKETDEEKEISEENKERISSFKRGRARRRRNVTKESRSDSALSSLSLKKRSRSRSFKRRKYVRKNAMRTRRASIELSRSRSRDFFENERSLSLLKDEEMEERKGKYEELRQWNDLGNNFQGNFDESRETKEVDIWNDPPYPQHYFHNNMQNLTNLNNTNKKSDINLITGRQCQDELFKGLCESLEKDIPENIQITQENTEHENPESMNASLLTTSEARELASAIGYMHKIKEIKTLNIDENLLNERSNTRTKPSPSFNKWIFKEQEEKEKKSEGENWFSPLKESAWKKTQNIPQEEMKPHEGSFCMRCWENPIYGPIFKCLACEYVEYCEKCVPKITHCHSLTRINELENDKVLTHTEEENLFFDKFRRKAENDIVSNDIDPLGKSLENSLNLWTYQPVEEQTEKFKFEYKEISSTPLSIKSNQREWCLIYKTICLKNIGRSKWERCHLEPVGEIAGTMTEVSYVAVGDSVLLTLEIHGFFTPGKYISRWRVVHQGEDDITSEMGHLELEFDILENRGLSLMDGLDYEMELRRNDYLEGEWKF